MIKDEVCLLVALEKMKISTKFNITNEFGYNMYKFKHFNDIKNVIKENVGGNIRNIAESHNVSKSKATSACNKIENEIVTMK